MCRATVQLELSEGQNPHMKDRTLSQLQELSALLNSSLDQATIRKRAIEATTVLMNAEAGSLLLLDEADTLLLCRGGLHTKLDRPLPTMAHGSPTR